MAYDEQLASRVRALLAGEPDLTEKKMFGGLAFLVGGNMAVAASGIGYSANEGKMLSLAVLEPEHARPGTEVVLVWGEPRGGSAKPTVEPHVQTEPRAIVSPVPYVETVRRAYAPGSWRAAAV